MGAQHLSIKTRQEERGEEKIIKTRQEERGEEKIIKARCLAAYFSRKLGVYRK